ncbi:MAG TPA: hypothetical protein VIH05_00340 [Tepidiformaceae bacterium]
MSIWFVLALVLLVVIAGLAIAMLLRAGPREGRTRRNINLDPGIATYTHGEDEIASTDRTDEPRHAVDPPEPPDQAR